MQDLIQTRQSPSAKWLKAFITKPTSAPEMRQLSVETCNTSFS